MKLGNDQLQITKGAPLADGKYKLIGYVRDGYHACNHLTNNGWRIESISFGPSLSGIRKFKAVCV